MNLNFDIYGVTLMSAKQAGAIAGGKSKQGKKSDGDKPVDEPVHPHGGAGAPSAEDDEGSIDKSKIMSGFFKSIAELKEMGHTMYFNSMSGPDREKQVREFFRGIKEITDIIPEENWHFVRTRSEKTKTTDATKADLMIDDRLDIVENVKSHGVKHVLWFTNSSKEPPAGVVKVKSWKEIVAKIKELSV